MGYSIYPHIIHGIPRIQEKILNRHGFPIESWDPGGRVPALRQPPKVVAPWSSHWTTTTAETKFFNMDPKSSQTPDCFCILRQCLLLRHCVWLLFLNDHCVLWGTNLTCAFRQVARAWWSRQTSGTGKCFRQYIPQDPDFCLPQTWWKQSIPCHPVSNTSSLKLYKFREPTQSQAAWRDFCSCLRLGRFSTCQVTRRHPATGGISWDGANKFRNNVEQEDE